MKFLIVFVAVFAVALAAPTGNTETLKNVSEVGPESFEWALQTSDGTEQQAKAVLKKVDSEKDALVVHGSFSWVDEKTGEKFTVTYVADENGYQPQGAHLPVAPQ